MRVFFLSVFLWCLKCSLVFASLDEDGGWAPQTVRVQAMQMGVQGTPDSHVRSWDSLPYKACLVSHCLRKCVGITKPTKMDADFGAVFEIHRADFDRFARLFDGCDERVTDQLSYFMEDLKPTDAEIDALNDLHLTPPLRMGALIARNWIPLSAARPDRVALVKKLLQGCDASVAASIATRLESYTSPDRPMCLGEIAEAGLDPGARRELISQIRGSLERPLPREALQGAFTAARALPVEKPGRLLSQASYYPDPAAYINASLQDLQTASPSS